MLGVCLGVWLLSRAEQCISLRFGISLVCTEGFVTYFIFIHKHWRGFHSLIGLKACVVM